MPVHPTAKNWPENLNPLSNAMNSCMLELVFPVFNFTTSITANAVSPHATTFGNTGFIKSISFPGAAWKCWLELFKSKVAAENTFWILD